jgi:hypothetical protein
MNQSRKKLSFLLVVLAIASAFSAGALKTKPAPEFPDKGAALDVSDWLFHKSVVISNSGPQQLELDLDVLSHAQRDFSDLRLMRQGEQIPYLVESATIERLITPEVTATNDPQNPTVSRWMIHLPRPRLPLIKLRCVSATPLFERDVTLYEILHEADRGDAYQQVLARGTWTKTSGANAKEFFFALNPLPLTDTLILEARNGDNPPIQLNHFQMAYTATSILFEAKAGDELFLCYGNTSASAPHYDLNLVSSQLRSADKSVATLGGEMALKETEWTIGASTKVRSQIFWAILALVVVVLLVVIARLLPKTDDQPPK